MALHFNEEELLAPMRQSVMRVIDKVMNLLEANLTKDFVVDDGMPQLNLLVDGKSTLRRFMTGKRALRLLKSEGGLTKNNARDGPEHVEPRGCGYGAAARCAQQNGNIVWELHPLVGGRSRYEQRVFRQATQEVRTKRVRAGRLNQACLT